VSFKDYIKEESFHCDLSLSWIVDASCDLPICAAAKHLHPRVFIELGLSKLDFLSKILHMIRNLVV